MPAVAAGFVFTHHDRRRLAAAMRRTRDARALSTRLQAVTAGGRGTAGQRGGGPCSKPAGVGSPKRWHATASVAVPTTWPKGVRSGRPPLAPALSRDLLTVALEADPLVFGYAASGWTAPLLAMHLREFFGASASVSVRTLRRRLHTAGLAWKRPRYVFAAKEPHRAQKKGRSCAA